MKLWPVFWVLATTAHAQLIVIDPGHGGRDSGAVGCGLEETDVVLDTALRIAQLLNAADVQTTLTRNDDRFIELRARAGLANNRGATLFVSVHANANSGNPASGTETFVANNASRTTIDFGNRLQRNMVAAWGLRDRGLKRANFTVITATSMPAALVEMGFVNRCDNDSAKLADPNQRQIMAQALAEAVTEQLNVAPPDPQPGEHGVLRGVVFEDQGVGLDDPSVRIEGAQVQITQTGAQMNSTATGAWSFDLPAGQYSVEASYAGYQTARRDCDVAVNGETWCSIGLLPGEPVLPDMALPDMALPDMALPDIQSPSVDQGPDATPSNSGNTSGGCAVQDSSSFGLWMLVLLLGLRRWREFTGAALALALFLPSARAHVPNVTVGGEISLGAIPHPHGTHLRLTDVRTLLHGAWQAALLAPDGQYVLLVGRDGRTLQVISTTENTTPQTLIVADQAGLNPRWSADSQRVFFRSPEQSAWAIPMRSRTLNGADATPLKRLGILPRVHADHIEINENGIRYQISPPGDVYFVPQVSPSDEYVVFWGLRTGLYLYDVLNNKLIHLGRGGHPQFGPNGRYLVFERTADEGAALTGGDLFIVDLNTPQIVMPLTNTDTRIELAPSLAGDQVVFVTENAVMIGRLSSEE